MREHEISITEKIIKKFCFICKIRFFFPLCVIVQALGFRDSWIKQPSENSHWCGSVLSGKPGQMQQQECYVARKMTRGFHGDTESMDVL